MDIYVLSKMAGSIMIIVGGTFSGFLLSNSCKERILQLREMQGFMNVLENEISYMNNILVVALENTANSGRTRNGVGELFRDCAKYLSDRMKDASNAWSKAIEKNKRELFLTKDDWKVIEEFGKLLGKSNCEGQITNFKIIKEKLKILEQNALRDNEKNQKMYRNLGFLGSLALVIMLL